MQQAEAQLAPILRLLWARRVLVIGVVSVFTVAGAASAFLTKPVYRATVLLSPADSEGLDRSSMLGEVGGLASLVGVNLGSNDGTAEAVALLRSRQFTEAFIDELGLLPRIFEDRWDAKTGAWRKGWSNAAAPTLYAGYVSFDRRIRSVVEDTRTGLVVLQIDWTDPAEGATWANELVARLNDTMRLRAIAEANASIELLTKELQSANVLELRQAISRTIETHVKNRALANVRSEYAFRVLDPAKATDRGAFIRPRRMLYLVTGPVVGLLFAIVFVLAWNFLATQMRSTSQPSSQS